MGSMSSAPAAPVGEPPRVVAVAELAAETNRLWHVLAEVKADVKKDTKDLTDEDYVLRQENLIKLANFAISKMADRNTTPEAFAAATGSNVPANDAKQKAAQDELLIKSKELVVEIVKMMDSNKDGNISYNEFHLKYPVWITEKVHPIVKTVTCETESEAQKRAARTKKQAAAAAARAVASSQKGQARFWFTKHDVDGNGYLAKSEVEVFVKDILRSLQSDMVRVDPERKVFANDAEFKARVEKGSKSLVELCDKKGDDGKSDGKLTFFEFSKGYDKWLGDEVLTPLMAGEKNNQQPSKEEIKEHIAAAKAAKEAAAKEAAVKEAAAKEAAAKEAAAKAAAPATTAAPTTTAPAKKA